MPAKTQHRPTEFHASMISAYKTCPRMYYYQYVEGLVPKAESTKLAVGRGVHIGLAAYYTHLSREAGVSAYKQWCEEEVPRLAAAHENPDELHEAAALGEVLLETYFDFAAENDDFAPLVVNGSRTIEVSFTTPLWTPKGTRARGLHHVGKFDGVVQDSHGRLWLLEHKTAKDFPSETLLRLDEQVGYYLLAAWQLFNVQPVGVIYNVIRKVDPKRARTDVVKRWKLIRNGVELLYMRERLYRAARTILQDCSFMPSPGLHCTWKCPYTQLCVCDHDGSDSTLIKETLYTRREEEPLQESKTKKN